MKVIIIGCGISGLTVAHQLSKNKNFEIEIYEKDSLPGGMAKSIRVKPNNVPTEHSWRGYAPFYYNLFKLLKEIPLQSEGYTIEEIGKHNKEDDMWTHYKGNVYDLTKFVKNHPGGNVILRAAGKDLEKVWQEYNVGWHEMNENVMKLLESYKIGKVKNNKTLYDNLNHNKIDFKLLFNKIHDINHKLDFNFYDHIYLFLLFGKVILSYKKEEFFKVRLDPLLKKNLSKNAYHFVADYLAGPGFGFDKNSMSLGHYAYFMEFVLFAGNWKVMKMPTSEGWIDPWVQYLKDKNVKFHFNSELKSINYKNKKITELDILINKKIRKIYADDYVFALNPFNFHDILKESNLMKMAKPYESLNIVNNQISFRLAFNKKINFNNKNTGFVLVNSPYNITFYAQEDNWDDDVKLDINGKIKTLISGTIIQPYNNGILFKKSALSLSLDELKKEIFAQFLACENFTNFMKKSNVKKSNLIFSEIYNDWYEQDGMLKTKNKKWVNNFLNEEYRPTQKTDFKNMFISGSHCRTSIKIWSMESAVESGIITSNLLLDKYNYEKITIHVHKSHLFIQILKFFYNFYYIFIIIIITFIFS